LILEAIKKKRYHYQNHNSLSCYFYFLVISLDFMNKLYIVLLIRHLLDGNSKKMKIYISLPVFNEIEYLPKTINSIKRQSYSNFKLFVCVNQPDEWWDDIEKRYICENNQKTLCYLKSLKNISVTIIDKTSKGNGWNTKKAGVGLARKTLMDAISNYKQTKKDDIILSLDADTVFSENYFLSIIENFKAHKKAVALSVPYYHRLTDNDVVDRAMLRYEIYMRYYSINLWRIKSPYSFTALGSAIALPVWAYNAIGGITAKKSGEDFYFLQKLRKYGDILLWNKEKVYPYSRFSDRVFFGTGPAMIKGNLSDWKSYPIYHFSLFDEIKSLYDLFPALFYKDVDNTVSNFFCDKFKDTDLWQNIRDNYKDEKHFVRACHTKIDGLRILQYLKSRQKKEEKRADEKNLTEFLYNFYNIEIKKSDIDLSDLSFKKSSVQMLNIIRNFLFKKEEEEEKLSVNSFKGTS